jgi:exportin-2 (importin alpha re-exporter)
VLTSSQTASGEYKLPENEVTTIKQNIITLMTQVPSNIQNQLGEAVSVIADSDFWERWDTLVDVRLSQRSNLFANCSPGPRHSPHRRQFRSQ